MEPIRGSKLVRFCGFSLTNSIRYCGVDSDIFVVGGYKWRICLYPNGDISKKGLGYISMYLKLASDKYLLQVSYSFSLVDPSNGGDVPLLLGGPGISIFNSLDPSSTRKDCWGFSNVIERKKLEEHPYYIDDSFTVECTITIQKEFHVYVAQDAPSIAATDIVPSLDLQKHFLSLLESGLGADVSFKVGTKTFNAHRCILAARSPVFRALLFGPLQESTDRSIVIHDMEPPILKAMLRFIYSDSDSYSYSYPENEDSDSDSVATLMAQHLLVAADRYELERLRQICEDGLMKSIDVATVATTLALAEQYGCMQLKEACLRFMASPRMLDAVTVTEGFQHLCLSFPSIAKHLSSKSEQCKSV